MRTDIKKILESFDNILNENKSLLSEAAFESPVDNTSVNSPFGPRWGKQHTGVDLVANAANVKSPADGVVEIAAIKNDDCGGTITINHADGFKTGYCHMQKINVQPGQKVFQGDVIGVSGGGPTDVGRGKSDGRHLHFTLRKDGQLVNPMDYIGKEGINLKGPLPTSSSDTESTSGASEDAYNYATSTQSTQTSTPQYAAVVGDIKSVQGLSEQKNFGKNVSNRYGRVIIPKDDNSKIKTPISGKINNSKYFSTCNNQVTIENNDSGKVYLQFCGISNPKVKNNQSVSAGDVLGDTDADVEVIMYDGRWNRINIPDRDLKIDKKEKELDVEKKKKSTEPEYYDPFMAAILGAPSKLFQDKYDKEGNRIEKRFGGVADKQPVDPWVLNFLKDPFKRKKVNENIEKIKKLL
jgi:biotin carboxyl carrier protein